jgi:hypothetical protein
MLDYIYELRQVKLVSSLIEEVSVVKNLYETVEEFKDSIKSYISEEVDKIKTLIYDLNTNIEKSFDLKAEEDINKILKDEDKEKEKEKEKEDSYINEILDLKTIGSHKNTSV